MQKIVSCRPDKNAEDQRRFLLQKEFFERKVPILKKRITLHSSNRLYGLLTTHRQRGYYACEAKTGQSRRELSDKITYQSAYSTLGVKLYLEEMRRKWHLEGVEYMRSMVREKFRLLGFRNALRPVQRRCVQYEKVTQTMNPQMPRLPVRRLRRKVNLFSICGVDEFGPFKTRNNHGRPWKGNSSVHKAQNKSSLARFFVNSVYTKLSRCQPSV